MSLLLSRLRLGKPAVRRSSLLLLSKDLSSSLLQTHPCLIVGARSCGEHLGKLVILNANERDTTNLDKKVPNCQTKTVTTVSMSSSDKFLGPQLSFCRPGSVHFKNRGSAFPESNRGKQGALRTKDGGMPPSSPPSSPQSPYMAEVERLNRLADIKEIERIRWDYALNRSLTKAEIAGIEHDREIHLKEAIHAGEMETMCRDEVAELLRRKAVFLKKEAIGGDAAADV